MSQFKEPTPGSFAHSLRKLRLASGLSQEEVAERARLSVNAIGLLERGDRRAPRRKTILSLATALKLDRAAHRLLEESARLGRAAIETERLDRVPTNLTQQRTTFVGRTGQVSEIARVLESRRVVTIVGTGGLGKTRLVIEVGERLRVAPFEGVWFVDLSDTRGRSAIFEQLAAVLNIDGTTGDLQSRLLTHLTASRVLLIIDNAEHVLADVAEFAGAFATSNGASRLLVTSREALGVATECVYRLQPMSFPQDKAEAGQALRHDAVALFVERLQTFSPNVLQDEEQLVGIVDICRHVEGNPLALELAAARAGTLGIAELRGSLDRQLLVLRGGLDDAPRRHQSLEDTIAWSYDLLRPLEKMLICRLAIFATTFTTEAAINVCGDNVIPQVLVPDLLRSLVGKSLIVPSGSAGVGRMRLLHATREFMQLRLAMSEEDALKHRLGLELAEIASRASQRLWWTPRAVWEATYVPELEDARVAVAWAMRPNGEPVLAARIISGLCPAWRAGGLVVELRIQLNALIARIGKSAGSDVVASLYRALVIAMSSQGDIFNTIVRDATAAFEHAGDEGGLALLRAQSAVEFAATGRPIDALLASSDALRTFRRIEATATVPYVRALATHASVLVEQGRLDGARPVYDAAQAIASGLGDRYLHALVAVKRAMLHYTQGDIPDAVRITQDVLASHVFSAGGHEEAILYADLAGYRIAAGDYAMGARAARLAVYRNRYVNSFGHFLSLNALAAALALNGNVLAARRHLLLATMLSEQYGWEVRALEHSNLRRAKLLIQYELGRAN